MYSVPEAETTNPNKIQRKDRNQNNRIGKIEAVVLLYIFQSTL